MTLMETRPSCCEKTEKLVSPEPNGLSWVQCLDLLRACAAERTIVAADIVELCPAAGSTRGAFAAARLAYRLIGYMLTRGGRDASPQQPGVPGPED